MSRPHANDRAVIDRLHLNYYDDGRSGDVRTRIDRILRGSFEVTFAGVVQHVLGRFEPAGSNAVYRVRRIPASIYLAVDGMPEAAAESAIAERWAWSVCAELGRTIANGSAQDVVRFDDPADYLASFLADLTSGFAGSRWYFAEFAHLFDLPVGEGTVHALAGHREAAGEALVLLRKRGQLDSLLAGLREADAGALWPSALGLDASSMPDLGAVETGMLATLRNVLADVGVGSVHTPLDRARMALRLYVAAIEGRPALAGSRALGEGIRAVLLLAAILPNVPAGWLGGRSTAIADQAAGLPDDLAAIMRWVADSMDRAGPGSLPIAEVVGVAAMFVPPAAMSAAREEQPTLVSEWAGLVLLLPVLKRLGIDGMMSGFPAVAGDPEMTNHLIYLLLASVAGPGAHPEPALAALAGLRGAPAASVFDALGPRDSQAAAVWGTTLAAGPSLEPRDLVVGARLRGQAWTIVLRDVATQRWVYAGAFPEPVVDLREMGDFAGSIRSIRQDEGSETALIGLDPVISERPATGGEIVRGEAARERLMAEMAHLWPGDALPVDPATAMAVGLAAALAVREVARHLPGIESSSLPYLVRNVFRASGTVRVRAETVAVSIESSPLQIVLRMAGFDGETAPIPWLGGRRLLIALA